MKIDGLTPEQVALLDEMWACETLADFEEFLETLDPSEKLEALRLQKMILLAALDEDVAKMQQYPEASKVILDIMRK